MTKYISILVCPIYLCFHILNFLLYDFGYYSSSYDLMGSIVACATSINSLSSALSSYDTYLIRFIILTSSSLPLSLKTSIISKLLIRGAVPPSLFASVCAK